MYLQHKPFASTYPPRGHQRIQSLQPTLSVGSYTPFTLLTHSPTHPTQTLPTSWYNQRANRRIGASLVARWLRKVGSWGVEIKSYFMVNEKLCFPLKSVNTCRRVKNRTKRRAIRSAITHPKPRVKFTIRHGTGLELHNGPSPLIYQYWLGLTAISKFCWKRWSEMLKQNCKYVNNCKRLNTICSLQ